MKVALVHDWLETWGGGENVLVELLAVFPGADVFALVDFLAPEDRARLGGARITTSWMQSMPGARQWFRHAAVSWPQVMEGFDLRDYDLIVSVSHAIAKGVRKQAGQVHVCYCNSPARFAWGMIETYRARAAAGSWLLARGADLVLARFRRWDLRASRHVDRFVANSQNIARAIETVYGRHADVVYPPVHVDRFAVVAEGPRTRYLTLSRLVPYKRVDLIVEAFRLLPHLELRVIGDGPDRARLEARRPANVALLGRVPDSQVAAELASARAFVFAAEEDFGIAPLEAQAAGTPVIAYGKGGVLETVRGLDAPNPTGSFFPAQTAASLAQAIEQFEAQRDRYDAASCRDNAARFAPERFRAAIRDVIASAMREHASRVAAPVGSAP